MLEFKKITYQTGSLLSEYYGACPYESCEYSTGIKVFWSKFYPYEYAVSGGGALIVKYSESGNIVFDVPVLKGGPMDKAGLAQALDEIDDYCIQNEILPIFSDIPEDLLPLFITRYNFVKIENFRDTADYIYKLEDLRDMKGRHYAGQRNHINKFKSLYTDFTYRELSPKEDLSAFWPEYYSDGDNSPSYVQEKDVAMQMAESFADFSSFYTGAIQVGGELAAFCIGEVLGNRVIVHIEKALTRFEGIYPLLVSEFLKHLPSGIEYVNREDDSGDRGLRISKLQYRPCKILNKHVALLQSELLYVDAVPSIQTERLVLNRIEDSDAALYQALCLDYERNKYWGYDYREDLPQGLAAGKLPADYFLQCARRDFEQRLNISLAIRLQGKMIGELILYAADCKGSIEIGCRLFKEYEGRGYGREAMAAAANWAIYKAGFRSVRAKCFKENGASFAMLSSFMKQTSQDSTFIYFEKLY